MSSIEAHKSATPNLVFIEAQNAFLDSLPPCERKAFAKCASVKELIADIKNKRISSRNPTLLRRAVGMLERLNQALSPYFDAIGMFVQSHPEFAALAWGGIRLALQLASNYTTFFAKLERTLERLRQEFPQYDELMAQFKKSPPPSRLKESLTALYSKLLHFIQTVVGIFTRKDGTARRSHAVFADICWRPYDLRFQDLLEDMKFRSEVVKSTVQFAAYHEIRNMNQKAEEKSTNTTKSLQELQSLRDNLEKAKAVVDTGVTQLNEMHQLIVDRRDRDESRHHVETLRNMKSWLEPPVFAEEFEQAIEVREDGTAEWLFREPAFARWSTKPTTDETKLHHGIWTRSLWILGNPGCGKTILAASTIDELRCAAGRETTCYFFFKARAQESDSRTQAYRAILSQTLQQHHDNWILINKFVFAMVHQSSGQIRATGQELNDLLRCCAKAGFIQNIVLDGIDECNHPSAFLSDLSKTLDGTSVKIILFSRPHVKIPTSVPLESRLTIEDSTTPDIKTFLKRRLEEFLDQGLLQPDIDIHDVLSPLSIGAGGMFLWARLMIDYLASRGLTITERLKLIKSVTLPEGLDKMYERIFESLSQGSGPDQALGRWIFMWVTFSPRNLLASELEATFNVRSTEEPDNDADFSELSEVIIFICGSLVERVITLDEKNKTRVLCYRFIHLSVSEFLEARLCHGPSWFLLSTSDSHLSMARSSLQYLSQVCTYIETVRISTSSLGPAQKDLFSTSLLREKFPLCEYALVHWIWHLERHHTTALKSLEDGSSSRVHPRRSEPLFRDILRPTHQGIMRESFALSKAIFDDLLSTLASFLSRGTSLMAYIETAYALDAIGKINFESFQRWLIWAAPEAVVTVGEEEDFDKTFQAAAELVSYLMVLNEDWGPTLQKRPYLIWDEVTAFTPCRLLRQTTSTKIQSLVSDRVGGPSVSSKPLCKVSEISNDQKHIGILSIWPSAGYEKLPHQSDHSYISMDTVYESASGWVARYEVWTLDFEPKCLVDARMALKSDDVWRQYCHSLVKFPDRPGFRLQFPINISTCIYRFSILQNVYSIQINNARTEAIVSISSLPLSLDEILSPFWLPHKEWNSISRGECFESWRRIEHSLVYFIVFSPEGDCVFFMGKVSTTNFAHLAIFDLRQSQDLPSPRATLFKYFSDWTARMLRPPDTKQTLHPKYPLAVFSIIGLVYLWNCQSEDSDTTNPPFMEAYPLDSLDPEARLWHCYHMRGDFDSITFSADGDHIVLVSNNSTVAHPVVISLPNHILAKFSTLTTPTIQSSAMKTSPSSGSLNKAQRSCDFSDTLIKSADYVVATDNTSFGVSTNASKGTIELQTWGSSNGSDSRAKLEISALPDSWGAWGNLMSTSASIEMPKTRDEMIRIVLNQAAKPWHSMMEVGRDVLPAVIYKDAGSVRMISRRGGGSTTRSLLEGQGPQHLKHNDSESDDAEPPPKRGRRG